MKTYLTIAGSLLLFCATAAFAQTSGGGATGGGAGSPDPAAAPTGGATNATSSGPDTVSGPGVVTDRTRNPASTTANPAVPTSSAVGILVRSGQAYLVRGGTLEAVDKPMSLTVSPDGAITGFDGKTINLPEGHMLTMDGRMTAIPATISGAAVPGLPPQAVPNPAAQANEEMARANMEGVQPTRVDTTPTDATVNAKEADNAGGGGGGGGSANRPRQTSDTSTTGGPMGSP